MQESILFEDIGVFDVEKGTFRSNLDILIENGTIKEVGKVSYTGGENLLRINGSGKFAVPGLFECHAHLVGLTTEGDETKKKVLSEFVAKGITQVRDVGGPLKTLKKMKDDISSGEISGPEIFYAGPMLEKGPLFWERFNKELPGFTVAINTKEDAKSIIQELSNCGASLVKTFNKFDVDVFRYLVSEAKVHNLPVTLDPGSALFHSVPMDIGIDLGIKCFEHGKVPWPLVLKDDLKAEHDSLLAAEAGEEDKRVFSRKVFSLGIESISVARLQELIDNMRQNDVCICPTLHVFKEVVGDPPEEYNWISKDELEIVHAVGQYFTGEMAKQNVKILVGQDGHNPEFTLNEMQLLRECGLSESEIIKGATIYAAKWLGVDEQLGSISPDKRASILILNENPLENIQNIRTTHVVLQSGKIVFRESSS